MPSTRKQPAGDLHAKRSPPRPRLSDGLERLQATAKKRGGLCLTEQYEGVHARFTFVCAQGHQWSTAGTNILYVDTWCRICCFEQGLNTHKHPQGLARLQEMAANHGGVCTSERYTGLNGRYTCRCSQGHTRLKDQAVASPRRWTLSAVTASTQPCSYQSPSTMRSAARPSSSSECSAGRWV